MSAVGAQGGDEGSVVPLVVVFEVLVLVVILVFIWEKRNKSEETQRIKT